MKTQQLATVPGLRSHPPQPLRPLKPHPVRRVGLLDRAAMHLGIALIRWGRRPIRVELRNRPMSVSHTDALRAIERYRDQYQGMTLTQLR
jgi:hypothetical protein